MKLLKIRVPSGFKMLTKDFEINFMTKTRINKEIANSDLVELEKDFYYPKETIFIGKNSSGKTTTLSLIRCVLYFLINGRLRNDFLRDGDAFELEMLFYNNGIIYKYNGKFVKDGAKNSEFLIIENELLEKTTMKDSYKKDLSNASYFKEHSFSPNNGSDTSTVNKYAAVSGDPEFNTSVDTVGYDTYLFNAYHDILGEKTFKALIHLFDDSVESIKPYIEDGKRSGYNFKRVGSVKPIVVYDDYLQSYLSAGTLRGINLYGMSIIAFKRGGTIIVDEIEKSFNRNLIENLLLMFNDESINKNNASIIYSTHYSELLDINNRCDNVNVLHRDHNSITLMNVHADYKSRTDMLKSGRFNQNVFDTLINYDRLMELKETLR